MVALSDCKTSKVDMVIMMDGSGSVGSSSYAAGLTFLQQVVNSLTFKGKGKRARVAMLTFSTTVTVNFELTDYTTKSDVINAISRVPYPKGYTRTDLGLRKALQLLEKHKRGKAVPKIIICLTDGRSTEEQETKDAADAIRNSDIGAKLYVVGIGSGVDKNELNYMASTPTCTHRFELTSYSDAESFVPQLQLETCKGNMQGLIHNPVRSER